MSIWQMRLHQLLIQWLLALWFERYGMFQMHLEMTNNSNDLFLLFTCQCRLSFMLYYAYRCLN